MIKSKELSNISKVECIQTKIISFVRDFFSACSKPISGKNWSYAQSKKGQETTYKCGICWRYADERNSAVAGTMCLYEQMPLFKKK